MDIPFCGYWGFTAHGRFRRISEMGQLQFLDDGSGRASRRQHPLPRTHRVVRDAGLVSMFCIIDVNPGINRAETLNLISPDAAPYAETADLQRAASRQ